MRKLLCLAALLTIGAAAVAQESAPRPAKPPRHFYKLTYVLKESDEGKVVNQRTFVVTGSTGDVNMIERYASRLRAGSRYPVRDEGKTNYIDVGVNLDTRLEEVAEGLAMDTTAEISSVGGESTTSGSAPVLRQVRTNAQAVVALNKSFVLFTVDDPASRHQFQLEVTAAPQR
ncbi:MAG TPA: hypothetical protein VMU45_00430 [Candidatus Eisenbacteria bacterium]|nr:hypothetical protein [Candidatus Eisenbacteria bacterium]